MDELPRITEIDISGQARALALLRLTDYALVVLCGFWAIGALSAFVFDVATGDLWLIAFELLSVAVLGFAAYTGWRHVGVIDPSVWWAYRIVFPVLVLYCLVVLWGSITSTESLESLMEQDRAEGAQQIGGYIVAVWVGAISLLGWLSLTQLTGMKIGTLGSTVSQVLSQLARQAGVAAVKATDIRRINTPRGLIIGGAGVLILLVYTFAPIPSNERLADAYLRSANQVMVLAFFLLVRARRYFQIDADSLLAVDHRSPILFLRSFDDDEKQKFGSSQKALLDFSLETRLTNHFSRFGPFIAVGSPKETIPQLGAARVLLRDDEWQGRVLGWIKAANLIIMYSGATQWVNWELRQVIDSGRATSLILMFPEIKGWRSSRRKKDLEARVEKIREVFQDTPWKEEMMAYGDFMGLRAMLFRADGSMIMIKSRSRSRDAYHLAALIAHQQLLAGDTASSSVDAGEPAPPARRAVVVRGAMIAAFVTMLAAAYLVTTRDDALSPHEEAATPAEDARLTFGQGEIYYGGQVSEEEARRVGEYLFQQEYFSDEHPSTVELHYGEGRYELGFVIDPQYAEVPLWVMGFGELGDQISREILAGRPVAVILYDSMLDPIKLAPLTGVLLFGKNELYYSEPATAADAQAVGESLTTIGFFSDDSALSVHLAREDDTYQLKFVIDTSRALDPETQSAFREISRFVASDALGNQPLVLHLCDDSFRTVQREPL